MSFSLSFAPEFFFGEGEPYDSDRGESKRPDSVWQAICSMSKEDWADLARNHYDIDPKFLIPETVLESIQETDTCSNLDSPVEVWIDPAGNYRLFVYDSIE